MDINEYSRNHKERFFEKKCIEGMIRQGGCCWMCGDHEYPQLIQGHHVAGRKNGATTIFVCPYCHALLTFYQRGWDIRWTYHKKSDRLRLAFILRGISDTLKIFSSICREWSDRILGNKLKAKDEEEI